MAGRVALSDGAAGCLSCVDHACLDLLTESWEDVAAAALPPGEAGPP